MLGGRRQLAILSDELVAQGADRPVGLRAQRVKVRKTGALASLLRPVGIAVAVLLAAFGAITLGVTFWRSYQRNVDHTLPIHADNSVFDIFFRSNMPTDPVGLVIRDVDGKVRHVVAGKGDTEAFVNDTIAMLDGERERIKQQSAQDIGRLFTYAFADRDQVIDGYADWFFQWKRSYVVLKDSLTAAINRSLQAGRYESLTEAVQGDVKDYFLRNYKEQVLRPEIRDGAIAAGLENAVRQAHDDYRRVVANGDMRAQLFLAQHTQHLGDVPANTAMTQAKLDWDAQKWKAPTYLMEDRAFDGIAGLGRTVAGGTIGALALGPVANAAMARSFGALTARFATSVGTRLAFAEQGAVAGTFVHPVGGQLVGAAAGLAIGIAADYFVNRSNEEFNRAKFVAANQEALDATIAEWKGKLQASVDTAIDRWFDDARASLVISRQ